MGNVRSKNIGKTGAEGGLTEEDSGLEESVVDGSEQKDEISSSASSCTYASSALTTSSCMQTFMDDDERFKSAKSELGASASNSKQEGQASKQKASAIEDLDLQMERETPDKPVEEESREQQESKKVDEVMRDI